MRTLMMMLFVFHALGVWGQRARLIPDLASVQYAGSVGLFNGGVGYNVFRTHTFSIHYGYVPKSSGGPLNILASKLVFNTFGFKVGDKLTIAPLNAGVMLSYHFGTQFRSHWPSHRYPEGYYWWKTSLRAHLLTETSVTINLQRRSIRSLTCFVELNTNELYLISYLKNSSGLRFRDIIKAGYGVRAHF